MGKLRQKREVRPVTLLVVPAALGIAAAGPACRSPVDVLPPGSVRVAVPDAIYRPWWQMVERCSGLTGNYDAIAWYRAPGDTAFRIPGTSETAGGIYDVRRNRIIMVARAFTWGGGVRHEMLHALLPGVAGHPRRYFIERCGEVVYCDREVCADSSRGPRSVRE